MSEDTIVYAALLAAVEGGRTCALATVIRTRGSVPRHVGSKMLIDSAVGLVGTIGGGCGEADVIAAADDVLESGVARVIHVELTDPVNSWSPAVCGGVMDVLLEPVLPANTDK